MKFKHLLIVAAITNLSGFSIAASAMSEEMKVAEKRIDAQYDIAHAKCDSLKGNAKDVCVLQAKGAKKVAKAELEVHEDNTPKNRYKLRLARAESEYDVAKEKCDDLAGNAKDVCIKDAKAAVTAAKADASTEKETSNATTKAQEKVNKVQHDAIDDKRDANYAAAKERCDVYSGDAKDRCISAAKAKTGVK